MVTEFLLCIEQQINLYVPKASRKSTFQLVFYSSIPEIINLTRSVKIRRIHNCELPSHICRSRTCQFPQFRLACLTDESVTWSGCWDYQLFSFIGALNHLFARFSLLRSHSAHLYSISLLTSVVVGLFYSVLFQLCCRLAGCICELILFLGFVCSLSFRY